jgi:hypothetical protein
MSSEVQSERQAALALRSWLPRGAVNIVQSLEVLGDLAGVHVAPADSVLISMLCFGIRKESIRIGPTSCTLHEGLGVSGAQFPRVGARTVAAAKDGSRAEY